MDIMSFRIWDKLNNCMNESDDIQNKIESLKLAFNEDCVFMPYVGIRDKNGKKIYQDDIIKYTHVDPIDDKVVETNPLYYEVSVVKQDDKLAYGFSPFNECDLHDLESGMYLDERSIEIIGNIFENPELVPKK